MAQSSAPIVDQNLSDANWRDLFGDEPGVVGDLDGSAYRVTLPTDSDVAQVGSSTQASLARVAGFSHRIPAGQPEGVTIPAASGAARTDLIALRYDPAHNGTPGPVRLTRIAGTSSGLPAYDASPPGVEDLPLWSITRQPGQALSQATVRRIFPRLNPVLSVDPGAPLPTSSPLGTRIKQGARDYFRQLDGNGVGIWSATGGLERQTPLIATGAGWRSHGGQMDFSCYSDTLTGRKYLSGWLLNTADFRPTGGEALFILPPAMIPVGSRLVTARLPSHQDLTVELFPDGWARIARPYGTLIPNNSIWSFDEVSYL